VEEQQTIEEYDFVIVGAGSAGCVVANRLSEIKEWKILLLEAGIEEPFAADVPAFAPLMQQSNIDWNYRTQPEKYSCRALPDMGCGWARGKVMGGSSSINYMIYMRGNRKDYDGWAARGNPGWHYKEVLHYFLKSEDNKDHDILHSNPEYHHRGGYQTVERFPYQDNNIRLLIDAWKELGYPEADMNADSQLGVMLYQHTSRHGERLSTNGAFIRPIRRKRRNLTIRTQAHVTRILIDQHTKQAFGVEYIRDGDDSITTVTARKEVILSAGSINSPKILMLSGVGPKKHLDYFGIHVIQNLKVGENLHDHVTIGGVIISINKTAVTASDEQRIEDLQKYRQNRKGPLSATGPIQVGVFIETEYSEEDDAPDIQLTFDSVSVMDYITNPTLQPNAQPLSYYDAINLRPIVLQPRSRGRVLLNTTDPIWGAPRIYPNYFGDYRDMKTLIAGIRHGLDMLSTEPLRHMGAQIVDFPVPECAEYKFASDDYWRCLAIFYTATIFHPVGTCKMGPHYDSDAVVDPELRVYGIENLRVIDSSIMPKIPRGNTNAPTIMIGEKGSDMIKKRWLQSYEQN
jgi:choline dehydrogenase